jgi:hypothetical protein
MRQAMWLWHKPAILPKVEKAKSHYYYLKYFELAQAGWR